MPEQYTFSDALGLFLTGATSDGGAQEDPDLSFGNYRSSTREEQIGFLPSWSIQGIVIERISGANGFGLGLLETISGDSMRWSAPGDSPGAIVEIANGQTKMLQSGTDLAKYIIISRHTAAALVGSTTIKLVSVFNNTIGSSNVPSGEAQVKLRCLAIKNLGGNEVRNLKVWIKTLATQQVSDSSQLGGSGAGTIGTSGTFVDWPATGFCRITDSSGSLREIIYYSSRTDTVLTVPATGRGLLGTSESAGAADDTLDAVPGIKIAAEEPVDDQFTVCEDEHDTDAVSGLSWSTGITPATGLDIEPLDTDEMIGIWLWLEVVEGRTASPSIDNILAWQLCDITKKQIKEVTAEAGITLSPAAAENKKQVTEVTAEAGITLSPAAAENKKQVTEAAAEAGITLSPTGQVNIGELKEVNCVTKIKIVPVPKSGEAEGHYRIADNSLDRYELYRGVDEEPDLEGEPDETFVELPYVTSVEPSAELHLVTRRRNKYNLVSLNITSWKIKTDADGQFIIPDPDAPLDVNITPAAGATGYVTAQYLFDDDDEYAATHWLIYFTDDGSDPNPDVDEPVIIAMNKLNNRAVLKWTSPSADNEDILKVLVRTRIIAGEESIDSINTDIYSCTASDEGPNKPTGRTFLGEAAESI